MKHEKSHSDDPGEEEIVITSLDSESSELSTEVALELESALDVETDDLPPLWKCVDPEFINSLATPRSGTPPVLATISFEYAGREITIERGTPGEGGDPRLVMSINPGTAQFS